MLVVGCIPIAVFFPTSSGLDQKYAVAVAVQHPGYIVGICHSGKTVATTLLACYYPYKKQTILYIAADNFLDHIWYFSEYIYIYIYR